MINTLPRYYAVTKRPLYLLRALITSLVLGTSTIEDARCEALAILG